MQLETKTIMIELDVQINAERNFVWDAFINDIGSWWKKEYSATGTDKMVIEPFLGGKMYEDCGNGTGFTWYTVEAIIPNESILLSGVMDHNWGGPCRTMLSLKFEVYKKGTNIKIVDSYIGHINENAENSFKDGWKTIFVETFKPYVENK